MSVAPAVLRKRFPEFADPGVYTDDVIGFWLGIAQGDPTLGNTPALDPGRWGGNADLGAMLFVCHHLAISGPDQVVAAAGGNPGQVQGILTAKAVDKVSASYDAASVTMEDAAWWNMSKYGIRLHTLARYAGSGGIQL